jgi:hypothetical protein
VREWRKFVIEALTLIAVVWYACIANNQLTAMRTSNEINHDALVATPKEIRDNEESQAAYLVIKSFDVTIVPGTSFLVSVNY